MSLWHAFSCTLASGILSDTCVGPALLLFSYDGTLAIISDILKANGCHVCIISLFAEAESTECRAGKPVGEWCRRVVFILVLNNLSLKVCKDTLSSCVITQFVLFFLFEYSLIHPTFPKKMKRCVKC